ncbi:restriction endonuclease subunit S [Nocardioides rotundus]|uniref:restriction endonuclease subunit S n=1 Tax=Nocardioides rotundus TaxID=1774216 RepID=UPI001CC048C9|nr:restriction endonuclease subunit S [Nocardioides rotundus]UAL29914.1 restriction endonuclease subunit S [Nocardioides rotundus]
MTLGTKTGGRDATQGVIEGRYALSVGRPNRLPEPPGYVWTPLSQVARLESGHTPSRSKPEYWDGEIPWIGIRDATGNHGKTLQYTGQTITQAGLDNSSARLLPAGTVCLSRTASVGYVVQMGVPMATSQDFVNWVCGPDLSPEYLKYVLLCEQDSIRRFAHGTTHQTMYYPEAKALCALLPERPVQDAVVEVLGALDDKIAANARLIDVADELATARFESMLGDTGKPLSSLARFVNGKAFTKNASGTGRVVIRIAELNSGIGSSTVYNDIEVADDHLARPGDLLFAWSGSLTVQRWFRPEGIVNQHIFKVIPTEVPMWVVKGALGRKLRDFRAIAADKATTMGHIQRRHLDDIVPVPDDAAISRHDAAMAALWDRALAAEEESLRLGVTRDVLLQQLMSGRLKVKDAESVVEGVV